MERIHKEAILGCRPQLVNETLFDDLADGLLAKKVFAPNMMERIQAGEGRSGKVRRLLDELLRRGPDAYGIFIECLRSSEQNHLADAVLAKERELSGGGEGHMRGDREGHVRGGGESHPIQAEGSIYEQHCKRDSASVYRMKSTPRGMCFIINNKKFTKSDIRYGTEVDCRELERLFTELGFKVDVKHDLTAENTEMELKKLSESHDLRVVDSFVLAILSHGSKNEVLCVDEKSIKVDTILGYFDNENCKNLQSKPRLMLLNSCRGDKKEYGSLMQSPEMKCDATKIVDGAADSSLQKIPKLTDFLIAYSTLEGYVSWRSEVSGTWFIQSLIRVIRKHAEDMHVLDMMVKVNREVVEFCTKQSNVQLPSHTVHLTKTWCFNKPK